MTNLQDLLLLNLWIVLTTKAPWGGWPGWSWGKSRNGTQGARSRGLRDVLNRKTQTKCMPGICAYVETEAGMCSFKSLNSHGKWSYQKIDKQAA